MVWLSCKRRPVAAAVAGPARCGYMPAVLLPTALACATPSMACLLAGTVGPWFWWVACVLLVMTRGADDDPPTTVPGGMLFSLVPIVVAVAEAPRPVGRGSGAVRSCSADDCVAGCVAGRVAAVPRPLGRRVTVFAGGATSTAVVVCWRGVDPVPEPASWLLPCRTCSSLRASFPSGASSSSSELSSASAALGGTGAAAGIGCTAAAPPTVAPPCAAPGCGAAAGIV